MPKALVVFGYGLNCEEETLAAFLKVGFSADVMHINTLINAPSALDDYQVLAIPGGFSFADKTGAGNAFSLVVARDIIGSFVEKDKLLIGICNGAQILSRVFSEMGVTLLSNDSNVYKCEWVDLCVSSSKCVWVNGIERIRLPIAHAEGKFFASEENLANIRSGSQIAMKYLQNPNGSEDDIAALTDPTGRVLMMMPHPERAIFSYQRDDWYKVREFDRREGISNLNDGPGIKIFQNAYRYFS